MKRTFIALKVDAGEKLNETIRELRLACLHDSVKWVETKNMHITLAFLGDTEEATVRDVKEMLERSCRGAGEIRFSLVSLGLFRNLRDPRVIWAGITEPVNLEELYLKVKSGLDNLGIRTEERIFRPHLTLGRIKSVRNTGALEEMLQQHRDTFFQEVVIKDLVYYQSILSEAGPAYTPLSVVNLND